ncbi:MAG: hypothetical protein ACREXP_28655, partial [Steroidobacteraceae bacterium]
GMTLLDAKLRDATPSAAAPDGTLISGPNDGRPGDTPVGLTELIANASAEYDFAVANSNAFVRLDYSYNGSYHTAYAPTNPLFRRVDGYSVLSGRIGFNVAGWAASVYVDNIFDEQGPVFIGPRPSIAGSTARPDLWMGLRPRVIGVNVGKDF